MTLEVLLSCMDQTGQALPAAEGITGNVLVIAQNQPRGEWEHPTPHGTARGITLPEKGLTKSRNLAIENTVGDICLLCDDDERFVPDYESRILNAYREHPRADVIIFKMQNRPASFPDKVQRLKFPKTLRVASWQISFRRRSLLRSGVRFDELLGAGTGNGAEEELKFLLDCQRAGLYILYVPVEIAAVAQQQSTWFTGFDEPFFVNRGATTRYILGWPLALAYAVYFAARKQSLYRHSLTPRQALAAMLRGMRENKITRQARAAQQKKEKETRT